MCSKKLVMELDSRIYAAHNSDEDVVIHLPDIKDEDYIPWTMEKAYFYPLVLDCQSNVMTLLLKFHKTGGALTHYHCGPLFGYVFQGTGIYLEKGGVKIKTGDLIVELTGVLHTFEVTSDDPFIFLANFRSGVIFAEKDDMNDEGANMLMYQDAYYIYNRAKQYYEEQGKDLSKIEMITTLGQPIRSTS